MQPHRDWSYLAFDNGEDVYRYQFTKENGYLGTNHSGEMVYCYGNLDKTGKSFAYDQSDYDLSKTMVSYWANFVKNGNPNGEGLPTWEKMSAHNSPLLELGKEIAPIIEKAERAYRILDEWKNREAEKELNK
jgi:para-nitrobenzyl esterase